MFEHFEKARFLQKAVPFLRGGQLRGMQQFDGDNGIVARGVFPSIYATKRATSDFAYYAILVNRVIFVCYHPFYPGTTETGSRGNDELIHCRKALAEVG